MSDEQRILDILKAENYYHDLRVLDDGTIVGTGKLMFTTALYIGLSVTGWERRYCYKDEKALKRSLDALTNGDDEPTGWIARRGG
jgi:hypothetical protein